MSKYKFILLYLSKSIAVARSVESATSNPARPGFDSRRDQVFQFLF